MKLPLLSVLLFVACAAAQTPEQAKKLAQDGNHREAADAMAKLIRSPDTASATIRELLPMACQSLQQLGELAEAEVLIEDVAAARSKDWQALVAAAYSLKQLMSNGVLVAGKFVRGNGSDGRQANVAARDRVRVQQLFLAARNALPDSVSEFEREDLAVRLVDTWTAEPWALQKLTDLTSLPEPEEGHDYHYYVSRHPYPVDVNGKPVMFREPISFADAKNDGERLRWWFRDYAAISQGCSISAKETWATMLGGWLGVHTLASRFHRNDAEEPQSSLASLHTLGADETTAMTATGPQRFTLPADSQFVALWQQVLVRGRSNQRAAQSLVEEFLARRQRPAAADVIRKVIELDETNDADLIKWWRELLDQITGPWGRWESASAQPAGKRPRLPLSLRNATKAQFTAHEVDIKKIIQSRVAHLKTKPKDGPYGLPGLDSAGIAHAIRTAKNGALFVTKTPTAEWERELKPETDHSDTRADIEVPLTEPGIYWIEGKFDGQHSAESLLYLEGISIIQTSLASAVHYFVCDATTGAPVPKAKLSFFGYDADQQDSGRYSYSFDQHSAITGEDGSVIIPNERMTDKQWLVQATDNLGRHCLLGFDQARDLGSSTDEGFRDKVYIITDRPLYRPGQVVKWKAWARRATYDSKQQFNHFAQMRVAAGLVGPREEEILISKDLKSDDYGAVEGSYTLPSDASLGTYQLAIAMFQKDVEDQPEITGELQFRVEEYKKPEFEVKVSGPTKAVALGDKFEFAVKADYYFGGAVKGAKVSYTITRDQHRNAWYPAGRWDWLFGKGYGWRNQTYDWYPGAAQWCICRPVGWGWGYSPSEQIATGEGALDANGEFRIKVDSAIAKELHGDQDHRYTVSVEVTDASRRTILGSGSVIAARRAFDTYLWMDRGYYRTGERGEARITARSLDGTVIKGQATLRVLSVRYEGDAPNEELVHTSAAKLDVDAAAILPLSWAQPGQYRVEATVDDGAGHQIVTSQFVVVHGDAMNDADFRFDDLELHLAKDEYAPGEEVEVVIHTKQAGSTVALFVKSMEGPPVWLRADGKIAKHRFKLSEADQPNVFLNAYTVRDATLHQVSREVLVPPARHIATVELITDKATYGPRDSAKATLRVKDQFGQPFVGQVVLTGYDKALEYISGGPNVGDVREFFWSWKRSQHFAVAESMRPNSAVFWDGDPKMLDLGGSVTMAAGGGYRTRTAKVSREADVNIGAAVADSFAGALAAAAPAPPPSGGEGAGPAPMIRSNLADSAVWVTSAMTNADGEAALDFPMPDNLTTWKLRSWVMGPRTQVGEAEVEVITRKDLMVRLQAPRFFVQGDEVTISANVHNESAKALSVRTELDHVGVEGEVKPMSIEVPAHSEKRFDWKVKAARVGQCTLTVSATADGISDAMQMSYPILERGALITHSRSLTLRPEQGSGSISFTVPAERKAETARLELRYAPTLAMTLVDALPFLTDYPHGCAEQTLNRFVPTVITLGVLKDLKIDLKQVKARIAEAKRAPQARDAVFDEEEVSKRAYAGLNRLVAMQAEDGGWGWFPGARQSSPHITAIVMHGLAVAARTMNIEHPALDRGKEWLSRYERAELERFVLPLKHERRLSHATDEHALVHSVLVELEEGDRTMLERLYADRERLSRSSVALVGLACAAAKDDAKRDMCLRNLRQFMKKDDENQTAWLDLPGDGWWYWWNDSNETQGLFLKLLCTVDPRGEEAARVAKHLVSARGHGHYWNSTRDTANAIEALATFAKASDEAQPDADIEVLLDGAVVKQAKVTRDNLFTDDHRVIIEGAAITTGEHRIELRRKGRSPLYVSAGLTMFDQQPSIPAQGLEVKVQRQYYKLTPTTKKTDVAGSRGQVLSQDEAVYDRSPIASGAPVKSGDLIEVELNVTSKNDYEYVLIHDAKPAGFEAVNVRSGWSYDNGLSTYAEYRDQRIDFYLETLPQGSHTLRYRVKAEIPGAFTALPGAAEAMYSPELRGNTASWQAVVGE